MKRFVLPQELMPGTAIRVEGSLYRHIAVVLRGRSGEDVTVSNGRGSEFLARIGAVDKEGLFLHILELLSSRIEIESDLILCQGIPKHDRMELVLQKGTELGVTRFVPFSSRHTVPRLSESAGTKSERWRRIILEAARQSRQETVPDLAASTTLDALHDALEGTATLFLYEGESTLSLRDALSELDPAAPLALVVGPEGGFSPEEAAEAARRGAHLATLGKRILRTETAGLAAVSIVQYWRGELG